MRSSLLVATCAFLLYWLFVAVGPRPAQARMQSVDQQNRYAIEEFARRPHTTSSVVYVGSSMTARLGSRVESSCAYNLALGGESSVTGLAAIEQLDVHPQLVLVEVNILDRTPNTRLVAESTRMLPRYVSALAVQNMPVNLAFSFLSQRRPADNPASGSFVLDQALAAQRDSFAQPMQPSLLAAGLEAMKRQVRSLEAAGTRVVFFELPVHPSLEDSVRSREIRTSVARVFPGRHLIGPDELLHGELAKTVDGIHLTLDEAGPIAEALAMHADVACAAPDSKSSRGSGA